MLKRRLFLASASPRRADILKQFNINFTVISNGLDIEVLTNPSKLRQSLRQLSYQKAYASKKSHSGLILGADTIVTLENEVLGKPQDINAAKKMLTKLSAKTHQVISANCIYDTTNNKSYTRSTVTKVTFNKLTAKTIDNYCNKYNILDKAGSYAIQDYGKHLVKKFDGCYYNIVGLPIKTLLNILKNYVIV